MSFSVVKHHTFTGHDGSIYALERGLEHGNYFSGGSDRIVCEWSLDPGVAPKALVNVGAIIYSLCLIPDNNRLLIGTSAGNLHVIDLSSRKEVKNIAHHQQGIFDIRYNAPGNRLYTVSGEGTLAGWKLDDLSLAFTVPVCPQKVRSIALHPGGHELAVACGDGQIMLIDPLDGKSIARWEAHALSCNSVVYDPSGKWLVSGGRDAHLNVWDAATHARVKSIPAHNYAIYSFAYSPDGRMLASASRDKTLKLWDAGSFELKLRIDREKCDGHRNSVNKVIWMQHPAGLISTGDDRAIMAWVVKE